MPLPKPPASKATLLNPVDFEAQAAPRNDKRRTQKAAAEPAVPAPLDLFDASVAVPSARPSAKAPAPAPTPAPRGGGMPIKAPLSTQAQAQAQAQAKAKPPAPVADPRGRKARNTGPTKLFVLDTNVLMHDPMSLFRFEEHDVFLPMITLEELDGHKKGMSEVARNARQVSRALDALATDGSLDPKEGIPLARSVPARWRESASPKPRVAAPRAKAVVSR